MKLTKEIVSEYFDYDHDTGILVRKFIKEIKSSDKMYNKRFAGRVCNHIDKKGYVAARILGKTQRVHRLAFILMEGYIPDQVDHINRERSDNRWCNLREVNNQENSFNRGKYNKGKTTSEYRGVSLHRGTMKWRAQIAIDGKKKHIGLFETEEQAHQAYLKKHKELTCGGFLSVL